MDVKVSIIIPCYNSIKYLNECISSVANQTLRGIEIIAVDDGSTDGSSEMLDTFAVSDSRIKVIHQKNSGVSAARNAALKLACGEFIGFVDSDDTAKPEMYERLYAAAKSYSAQIVCSGYTLFNNAGASSTNPPPFPVDTPLDRSRIKEYSASMHHNGSFLYIWRSIFSRELIEANSICFDTSISIGEDTLFCMKCFLEADCAVAVGEAYYNYRLHSQSAMRQKYKPALADSLIRQYNLKAELCKKYFPELSDEYFADAARHTAECFWYLLVSNIYTNDIKNKKNQLRKLCGSALIRDIRKYYDVDKVRSRSLDIVALRFACRRLVLISHLLLLSAFRKI